MASNGRPLIKIIFQNFFNSFRPRQWKGNLKGEDYFGNKFYEIPAGGGKSKTSRWFEPPEKENHEQEMAAEWESWLRGRRKEPPTDEELKKNLAIMQMKKRNGALLEAQNMKPQDHAALKKDDTGERAAFPRYEEYEVTPGKPKNSKD